MKILKVIHGYPPRYSAGSEVYSRTLAQELSNRHEVQVFTRQENSFISDYYYKTELDPTDPRILLHIINMPRLKYRDQFIHIQTDEIFQNILNSFKPDIVHFGHLNYLSLNLPKITKNNNIPSIFTLHDFWLMCPRGQFIQRNSKEPWELCDGQEDSKCVKQCYKGSFTGEKENFEGDFLYWKNWVHNRMKQTKLIINYIDYFIAPSRYLLGKFVDEFSVPKEKITYLDYGFNLEKLKKRKRIKEKSFVFGYIGTHTPQKGIHILLKAFSRLKGNVRLKIWGASRDDTDALKFIESSLLPKASKNIKWMGGYNNDKIVETVFNEVDSIVVPSIWGENSPLVIHEAQQVHIPVVTANFGGMSEYVQHLKNGLLFQHRDDADLAEKMQLFIDKPDLAKKLGEKGYLYTTNKQIPDIKSHTAEIETIYGNLMQHNNKQTPSKPGPWRITFDTNPDHCNFQCVMCECFSPYSTVKKDRVANRIKKRVMPIETIEKVLAESVGTPLKEIIPSTLGEPLLYKDFEKIIELCHKYNLKLNLTTNGSFPIKGVQKWADLLVPVLSDVKISWNGASKETHEEIMIGSNWEMVTSNLKTFIKVRNNYALNNSNRCRVTLQLTFLERNVDEIPELIKFAIKLGVDRVKGHHLWTHFDEIKDQSMRRSKESIKKWNKTVEKVYQIVNKNLLPNGEKLVLENIDILNEEAIKDIAPGGICPFLGKEAWVNTEGEFNPCCAPDELRKSLGTFGNVIEQNLQDIWTSKDYRKLQASYLSKELCQGCNMKKSLAG